MLRSAGLGVLESTRRVTSRCRQKVLFLNRNLDSVHQAATNLFQTKLPFSSSYYSCDSFPKFFHIFRPSLPALHLPEMSGLIHDEVEVDEADDSQDEGNEEPKNTLEDSSEEEDDDDDEEAARQVREGFIVDEDDEEPDERERRRKKDRKRRRAEREEEEAILDEEDLDLIGEANPEWERKAASQVSDSEQRPL